MENPTIALLGAGRMATALARGFVARGVVAADRLIATDVSPAATAAFTDSLPGARTAADNAAAAAEAGVVIVAVKPQQAAAVLAEIADQVGDSKLVVSIAAGVTLRQLAEPLAARARVVRVMPNTPCLIGQGASGFSLGPHTTADDAALTAKLLAAVGVVHELPEKLLDAVTGLSGSGPAFVYTVVEAMADAGVCAGLPRAVALDLATQTVAGAAQMVAQTGEHPAQLRDSVTSPGGTTAAGLAELDRLGLRHAMAAAVSAARDRSVELGAPPVDGNNP